MMLMLAIMAVYISQGVSNDGDMAHNPEAVILASKEQHKVITPQTESVMKVT